MIHSLSSLLLTLALLSPVAGLAASADTTWNCSQTIAGQQIAAVATDTGAGIGSPFSLTLSANGKALQPLGGTCFVEKRPGTNYELCSFELDGNTRLEVYPYLQTTSGAIENMQYVLWNDATPAAGAFTSCTH